MSFKRKEITEETKTLTQEDLHYLNWMYCISRVHAVQESDALQPSDNIITSKYAEAKEMGKPDVRMEDGDQESVKRIVGLDYPPELCYKLFLFPHAT